MGEGMGEKLLSLWTWPFATVAAAPADAVDRPP
jgi:hypothetical protein